VLRLTLCAVLASLALTVAPALASGGSNRIGGCTSSQAKPTDITLFCGDDGAFVDKIHWHSFGGATAKGSGTYSFNPCKPDCAASKDKSYSVTFTASQAKPCWDGHDDYRALTLDFAAGAPYTTKKFALYCPTG
jgi:hypothetical protein